MLDLSVPQNPQQAKFSLAYCTALALAQGSAGLSDFDHTAVLNRDALKLMERFSAAEDPRLRIEKAGIELQIRLDDGHELTARVEAARGDPEAPFTRTELHDKFVACSAKRLGPERAESLYQKLLSLETADDMTAILWDMR